MEKWIFGSQSFLNLAHLLNIFLKYCAHLEATAFADIMHSFKKGKGTFAKDKTKVPLQKGKGTFVLPLGKGKGTFTFVLPPPLRAADL